MLTSPEILVPMDFSPCSVNALKVAIGMAEPEGDLTLLHVVDEEFIHGVVAAGILRAIDWGSRGFYGSTGSMALRDSMVLQGSMPRGSSRVLGSPLPCQNEP